TPLAPPLDPETRKPLAPEQLEPIFPRGLIEQEQSEERYIRIPQEVRETYSLWRPTPLIRAKRLEEAIGAKCRIYYKDESVSPTGSHKPNTAVAQAYYNKAEGISRLATETGAGQWGAALAFASRMIGLGCTVYMVRVSFEQKPYRRILIRTYDGQVHPSPSEHTRTGAEMLRQDPECKGSLGLAISEAVEDAANSPDAKYSLGSVLNHVLIHQTVLGLETKKQLEMAGRKPDYIIGCAGGGSNVAGMLLPFLPDKLSGEPINFLAAEPKACPTLTKGDYRYDYGDMTKLTPLIKMHTLGHAFMPPPIHSGGLRYHGGAPILCNLVQEGLVQPQSYYQEECFEAARLFQATEGYLPAPETAHAIKSAIDTAKQAEPGSNVVFLYSGHGLLDLGAYDSHMRGELNNCDLPRETIDKALQSCPEV
ncbi:MAG: TrpB-like pyridoxal phosphate-dependent enzyme, partial [Desulfohalobiaceae bacterium]|nr:TrpB-like pyridoxal phosphate-dependent enzyme [Desulfohalobiaceae bacterium]